MKVIGKIIKVYWLNILTMAVATLAFYLVDINSAVARATLAVSAGLVLAHVLPTWFLGFAEFDREDEAQIAFVYAHAGPIGFGGFFGSGLAGWQLGAIVPEGFTWSMVALTLIAALVSMSYWGSGTMSRKFLTDLFFHAPRPDWICYAIVAMKFARYHNRARTFMEAIEAGDLQQALCIVQMMAQKIPDRFEVWDEADRELTRVTYPTT